MDKIEARFWRFVNQNGEVPKHFPELGPCWLWIGYRNEKGYGAMYVNPPSKMIPQYQKAHRWAYEHFIGPINPGLTIDHLCNNPSCVNAPSGHLVQTTMRENVLRGRSLSALNFLKTHCKRGHEFTPENTYTQNGSNRGCRTCRQIDNKRKGKNRSHHKKV
jgi:hypothetical protein